ncbi:hypothetical protein BYT27DRAFT_7341856 [Phlegmacium glaucopus]|nr:hypothetical protein BYT27DRAFT_7341856 [Phlegmacium glaucopus]
MSTLTSAEMIGLCVEGFLCGIYSGIFVMYLQYQASKEGTDKTNNILFYSHCALYVLSVATFASDIAGTIMIPTDPSYSFFMISDTVLYACCSFIAQFILIYRCWIVWSRNIYVVIIPSILTFASLTIWLSASGSPYFIAVVQNRIQDVENQWGGLGVLTSLLMSLIVNVLVTGLIAFRIAKVYWNVKNTLNKNTLGAAGGSKLRSIIFIVIESGMALLACQMAWIVSALVMTTAAIEAMDVSEGVHEMVNGIAPTIIQMRVSMGLSFYDATSMISMVELKVSGGLHCVSDNNSNSISEMGGFVRQESRDCGFRRSDGIDVVER